MEADMTHGLSHREHAMASPALTEGVAARDSLTPSVEAADLAQPGGIATSANAPGESLGGTALHGPQTFPSRAQTVT